ncbi:MAG: glycoside hydrolase family 13 protein [Acholeplasmataceae bacterium]|jgi:glycosidase|nr:glycoside hydrolase family 13 protein [Acholeplasmataceae bacterium]
MNKLALWHNAKSEYSYAYDEKTLHIVLRTAKNDLKRVEIISGDPFSWIGDKKGNPAWKHSINLMTLRYQSDDFDFYFIELKPPYLRTKYAFLLHTHEGETYLFGSKRLRQIGDESSLYEQFDLSEYYNYPYLNHEDLHHTPSWVKDTVWYQIFPDRFNSFHQKSELKWGNLPVHNNEIYGGDLLGVIEKLDYLHDLGVTGIYFTPLFEAPTAHKYDTKDYFKIDPQFGTNDDFKLLVQKAHEKGIKVMLDGVFNHSGYDHPFFQDVIKNGELSPYKDCFFIDKFPVINFPLTSSGKPTHYYGIELNLKTFAFTPHMPKWNTSNPIAEKHLLDCITYWIKEYDIDGWRLDVSNEISHDFLRQIKKVSRLAKKDTFILGENWDSSIPWLHGDQLDSVMNYELSHPLWKFLEHKIDLSTFKNMVIQYLATTPKNVMENMFNLVGSHDTIRIKRRLKDDARRMKLSYLFMFLSAGAPNIYYGDEIGMTGEHDPDNRRCMLWDKSEMDLDFLSFTKKLISLRKTHPSFTDYDYHFIDSNILAFTKKKDHDEILVFINNGDTQTIDVSSSLKGNYIDLIHDKKVVLHDKIELKEYEFLLLQREV